MSKRWTATPEQIAEMTERYRVKEEEWGLYEVTISATVAVYAKGRRDAEVLAEDAVADLLICDWLFDSARTGHPAGWDDYELVFHDGEEDLTVAEARKRMEDLDAEREAQESQ